VCATFWRSICILGRCNWRAFVGLKRHTSVASGDKCLMRYRDLLFQRIWQWLNTQCIRIVTHAEDAVRFHIVIHDNLHHNLTIFQFDRSQHHHRNNFAPTNWYWPPDSDASVMRTKRHYGQFPGRGQPL
ncbi:hypothetical protein AAIH68_34070, partial [Pseudomonas aeruginosa]|uniref:hypothetical protein n=1 Tax=Pseudomonas aeruginosa TaxID=287 RepID=UPI0031B72B3F